MKRVIIICALALLPITGVFAEYPPKGWTISIAEGAARAQAEGKMLLIYFAKSDTCPWCMKLKSEIWETAEFKRWSQDNAVMVLTDFPQDIAQSETTAAQNRALQQYFDVTRYPTIFLLDSDLTPLLKTGYREGGPEKFISHIEKDRNLKSKSAGKFQADFKNLIKRYSSASDS